MTVQEIKTEIDKLMLQKHRAHKRGDVFIRTYAEILIEDLKEKLIVLEPAMKQKMIS